MTAERDPDPSEGLDARPNGWGGLPEPHAGPPSDPTGSEDSGGTAGSSGSPASTAWSPAKPAPAAPKPGVVPLRPLGFGELLDGAFTTIQRYPAVLLGLSAIMFAVFAAAEIPLSRYFGVDRLLTWIEQPDRIPSDAALADAIGDLATFAAIIGVLLWLIATLLIGVITITTARGVLGAPTTLRTAWAAVRRRLPPLLGLLLVIGLTLAAIWLPAIGVPARIAADRPAVGIVLAAITVPVAAITTALLAVRWSVAAPVLLLETRVGPGGRRRRIRLTEALGRSWRLVAGRGLPTFGVIAVAFLIAGVVATVLNYAFTMLGTLVANLAGNGDATSVGLIGGIGYISGGVLQVTFITAVTVLVYADARMRTGDIDLAAFILENTDSSPDDPEPDAGRDPTLAPWTVR